MRKTIVIALALIMTITLLVGCESTEKPVGNADIDFKSVLDTETGNIISLGDTKESVDNALGSYEVNEQTGGHAYLDGLISVLYDLNDNVSLIIVYAESNRFEFRDMSLDMTKQDIIENFNLVETFLISFYFYQKYYDAEGTPTSEDDAKYMARISITGEPPLTDDEIEFRAFSLFKNTN